VIEEDGGRGGYGGRAPYQGQDRMAMQAPPQAGKGMQAPFEMTQERPGVNVTNAHVDEFAFLHAVEPLATMAGRRRWPPQDKRSADETRDYLLQLFFEQGFGQQQQEVGPVATSAAPSQTLDLASMLAQQREKTLGGIRYVYDKSEVLQPGSILRQQDSEVGANKDTVVTVVDEILQKRIKAIMEERLLVMESERIMRQDVDRHEVRDVSVISRAQEETRRLIDLALRRIEEINKARGRVQELKAIILQEYDLVVSRVMERSNELQQTVWTQKEAFIKAVTDMKDNKLSRLQAQDAELTKLIEELNLCAAVNEALLDIEDYKTIYKFFPEHELQLQAALMTECQTTPCENWKLSISDDDTVRVGEMIQNFRFKEAPAQAKQKMTVGTGEMERGMGKLYAIGGWDSGFNLQSVECFDPQMEAWETVAPMICRRRGLCAASLNGCIYSVGGWDGEKYLSSMEKYDPRVGKWILDSNMSRERCYASMAVLNGKLYVAGGYHEQRNLDAVEVYDPRAGAWDVCKSLTVPRRGFGLSAVDGWLYAVGGWNGTHNLDSVERFDPQRDEWMTIEGLSCPRSSLCTAVLHGKVYAVGGWDGTKYLQTCERFAPKVRSWEPIASMGAARSYGSATAMLGRLFALGGWDGAGGRRLDSAEMYDPRTNQWMPLPKMNCPRYCVAAVAL